MATLQIEEICVKSRGGYDVVITGIAPTDCDCIAGTINTPGLGIIKGRWDLSGYLRDGEDSCNLNMSDNQLGDLIALLKQLGAK